MADAAISSGNTSLGASGLNSLLTFFWDQFRAVKKGMGTPLAFLNGDVSSVVAVEGQTVTIPLLPTISTSLLTDGNAVPLDDSVGSNTSVSLNRHRVTAWSWTQVSRSLDGDKNIAGQLAARVAGEYNDTVADILSTITTGFTTNTAGTGNTALTEAVVVEAVADIMANMPNQAQLTGLLSPDLKAWGALAQLARFTDYDVRGTQNSLTGEGSVVAPRFTAYGVNWVVCHGLPSAGTTRYNAVFARDALVYAMRAIALPLAPGAAASNFNEDGVVMQLVLHFDGDRLADRFTLHTLYGSGVGREEWGSLLLS